MEIEQSKVREYATRLLRSRMRVLADHGFYGYLLEHLPFALDTSIDTAMTDAQKIYFSPEFIDKLSDDELDFVLMHEVLHVALKHCFRYTGEGHDQVAFNIACDTVVNSTIFKSLGIDPEKSCIRPLGEVPYHLAPNKKEGHEYTAEEIYHMLMLKAKPIKQGNSSGDGEDNGEGEGSNKKGKSSGKSSDGSNSESNSKQKNGKKKGSADSESTSRISIPDGYTSFDEHGEWSQIDQSELGAIWQARVEDAVKAVSIDKSSASWGNCPAFAQRILLDAGKAQTNWREVLCDFVQEEICDYSFSPPDRRFSETDFFMPDFNEKDESVKNLLFMIDTSGSMSDKLVTEAFDEVRGALAQFDGRLEGYLGFFDAVVVNPQPFSSIQELEIIRPKGGGGTNFDIIFKYATTKMDERPYAIIILTDGYAPFPSESIAEDIPTLWIINNKDVTPPWGRIARIESEGN